MLFGSVFLREHIKLDIIAYAVGVTLTIFFVVQPETIHAQYYMNISISAVAIAF